jgi:hypothetical protein
MPHKKSASPELRSRRADPERKRPHRPIRNPAPRSGDATVAAPPATLTPSGGERQTEMVRAELRQTAERSQIGAREPSRDPAVKPPTVGEWLAGRKKLRPGTARSYAGHIRLYLDPHIEDIPIAAAAGIYPLSRMITAKGMGKAGQNGSDYADRYGARGRGYLRGS